MRIRILGSAAGGGLPQWNCRCANCQAARADSPHVQARTQSSVAVSADGRAWYLLNVSADIRQQILKFPELTPLGRSLRGTTLAGCVLTDAEIDHTSGLLQLREGCTFGIFSTQFVHQCLTRYLPIETVLAGFADRPWTELPLEDELKLPLPGGDFSGLSIQAFETGLDVPRYVAKRAHAFGAVIGLRIEDANTGGVLVYAPGVQDLARPLIEAAHAADVILVDGTFWTDDEPIDLGISHRTAQQMGHIPVSGPEGSLNWLAGLPARHRVYVHMNNTNPMLNNMGAEHQQVTKQGVRVAMDGDVFEL